MDTGDLAEQNDPQCGLEDADNVETDDAGDNNANGDFADTKPMFQNGVLRTNCIDCLDRTNVAQFAYGLAALGHQLHALDMIDIPKIDLDSQLADNLMGFYEKMGDTLAHQYGGSAAHNKVCALHNMFSKLLENALAFSLACNPLCVLYHVPAVQHLQLFTFKHSLDSQMKKI